ncbi:MAG: succinylglutamate desuccinylase/aspartoacylase family protein [Myxococcota bacterium]
MARSPGVHFVLPTLPVHVLEGRAPGPTAIVEAGIHGDEVAGPHALDELLEEGLTPVRGRLIIIPRMNPPACRARARVRPGGSDMNRCFPGDPDAAELERRLAGRLMALIADERPALVATLHESHKRHHPDIPASFGQSVVYGVTPRPEVVDRVVDHMNEDLAHPYERWAAHHYPVPTSSTEVIVEKVGCVGLCIETWMGFEEARRVAMQREVVMCLLRHFELL